MRYADVPPTRFRIAIAVSIVAHLCVLWLLVPLIGYARLAGTDPALTSPEGCDLCVVVRKPLFEPRIATMRAVRAVAAAAPVAATTDVPAAVVVRRRGPRPGARAAAHDAGVRARPAQRPAGTLPAVAGAPSRPSVDVAGVRSGAYVSPVAREHEAMQPTIALAPTPAPVRASPTAEASVTPAAAPASAGGNFAGLFSQNYAPAFAQPAEIGALRASISGHARLRIDVDENGHATDVRFTPAIGDAALADELRTKLLSLRYVPADCNGLPCDGILDVLL